MAKRKTRTEIINGVAAGAGISKRRATLALKSLVEMAAKGAKNGFTIPGLGKLVVLSRKFRLSGCAGRGGIEIPGKTVVKLRIAKTTKDAILKEFNKKIGVKEKAVRDLDRQMTKQCLSTDVLAKYVTQSIDLSQKEQRHIMDCKYCSRIIRTISKERIKQEEKRTKRIEEASKVKKKVLSIEKNKDKDALSIVQPPRQSLLERLKDPTDEEAWKEFYVTYSHLIVRYAQKLGLDETSAFDLLQETMVALIRILPKFRYDQEQRLFWNLLMTIVHRKASTALKKKSPRPTRITIDGTLHARDISLFEDVVVGSTLPPDEQMDKRWRENLLGKALQRIRKDPMVKERTFKVFCAYTIDGMRAKDVANKFGVDVKAVYQIKDRMMKRLKQEVDTLRHELD